MTPIVASVGPMGDLVLGERCGDSPVLHPPEALRFARWILDIFEDP